MKPVKNLYRAVCLGLILPLCFCFGSVSFGAQTDALSGDEAALSDVPTESAITSGDGANAEAETPSLEQGTAAEDTALPGEEVSPVGDTAPLSGDSLPSAQAVPTASTVLIDGKNVAFEAYNIGGYNYFKLRDLAMALSGSEKQFELTYHQEENTIDILPGAVYTPDGKELEVGKNPVEKSAEPTPSTVILNGSALELVAYNIDGYNYFKLRDVGGNLDFYVGFDGESGTIQVDTQRSYDKTADENPWSPDENPGIEIPGNSALEDTYALEWVNEYSNYFTNKVDGYRMMVPGDMQVDMGDSEVRAVLENPKMRIEIYRQEVGGSKGFSGETYRGYSNRFISDSSVHTKLYEGDRKVGHYSAHILEWKRNPFSKVAGDRYYYASVDVTVDSRHILTFLFKSAEPFGTAYGSKSYLDMLDTFTIQPITAAPYTELKVPVEKSQWNQATKDFYKQYFGADKGVTWGIFEPAAPINYADLKVHEQEIGYRFPILLYYIHIPTAIKDIDYVLYKAKDDNRYLELTLQTTATASKKGNMVYDVLNGEHDEVLNSLAAKIAADGRPLLFRLANEMNGDWCGYCAWHTSKDTQIYVEFYRYIYNIFEAQGANANTIWIWNPNEKSFPNFDWNAPQCYYPGNKYVDIVGMTGYNTGTYYKDETWRSFRAIYEPIYWSYIAHYQQPLMITEFSCSKFGGNKAAWVEEMFNVIADYDRIKAAVWWDGCDWDANGNIARSYFINDAAGLTEVFRAHLSNGAGTDSN